MKSDLDGYGSVEITVANFLRHYHLDNSHLVVAVSGGPDSIALLLVLERLRGPLGLSLHVAHLNHSLRAMSDAEARYVRNVAKRLGLKVTVGHEDVKKYRNKFKLSLEEAAREVRYEFLSKVCSAVDAAAVLTAHTIDDQAETVLLHLLRGTGMAGLSGIQPVTEFIPNSNSRFSVVRPFLNVSKQETVEYCKVRRFRPKIDESNEDLSYLRNRIRLDFLPRMEKARPGAKKAVVDLASIAHQTKDYIDSMAENVLSDNVIEREGAFFMNVPRLKGTHSVLKASVFQALAKRLVGDPAPLASSHILLMEKHLSKPPGSEINLPRGLMLTMLYGEMVLSVGVPPCPLPFVESGKLTIPGQHDFGGWVISGRIVEGGGILRARHGDLSDTNPDTYLPRPLTGIVTNEQMSGGLYVRSRRPGDRIQLYTHSRKVQDMLVDAKIPRGWRDQVPIVCREDTGDLLWVVGLHNPKPLVLKI